MTIPYFFRQHKKLFLFVLVLVVVSGVLYIIASRSHQGAEPDITTGFSRAVPSQTDNDRLILEGVSGTVRTRDFISTTPAVNPQGDRILADTVNYSISYINPFRQFFIAFTRLPSVEIRQQAEMAFLQSLEISVNDACKLDIHETVPEFEGEEYAGVNFGFSSCPNSKVIPQ